MTQSWAVHAQALITLTHSLQENNYCNLNKQLKCLQTKTELEDSTLPLQENWYWVWPLLKTAVTKACQPHCQCWLTLLSFTYLWYIIFLFVILKCLTDISVKTIILTKFVHVRLKFYAYCFHQSGINIQSYLQALASEVLYTVKYFVGIIFKGAALILLVSGFVWLSWRLIQQNSIQNCLFLCYP